MKHWLPLAPLLLLLACGESADTVDPFAADQKADQDARIECAMAGAETFARVCSLEQLTGEDGPTLTIRNPDGGFRRLLVTRDGRGVVAADGAEPAAVSIIADNRIEVDIGGDRYRLPATVKGGQPPAR